jgi:hypothetical protein
MPALPPSCPPLPELPPLFWNQVAERIAYWQEFYTQAKPDEAPIDEMREYCVTQIKKCLKRIYAGRKNAGRSLFEMAEFVACLSVIDSRN